MATKVSIQIELDDSGAIKGIKDLDKELDRFKGNTEKSNSAQSKGSKELALQQEKARDATMLMNRLLGVQLPESIGKTIARSEVLGKVFSAAFSGAMIANVGMAIIGLFPTLASYADRLRGINEALDQQKQTAIETSRAALGKQGIPEIVNNIKTLNAEQARFQKDASWSGWAKAWFLGGDNTERYRHAKEELKSIGNALSENTRNLIDSQVAERQTLLDTSKARHDAVVSTLTGFDQISAKENFAIQEARDAEKQHVVTAAQAQQQIVTAHAQAVASRIVLQRQLRDQTRAMENEIALIGLSQVSSLRAKAEQEIEELRILKERGGIGSDEFAKRAGLISEREGKQENELRKQTAREGAQAVLQAQAAGAKGEEQIRLQLLAKLQQITNQEQQMGLDLADQRKAAELEADNAITELRRQTHEQLSDQTAQAEEQAALAMVPPWQRANAEVWASYNDRIRSIDKAEKELLEKFKGDADIIAEIESSSNTQRSAAWQDANGKIAEQHRQMVDQIAGQMESIWDDMFSGNLARRMIDEARRFFFKVIAQWLSASKTVQQSAQNGSFIGTLLGNLFGIGGGSGGGNQSASSSSGNEVVKSSFLPSGALVYNPVTKQIEAGPASTSSTKPGLLSTLGQRMSSALPGLAAFGALAAGQKFGGTAGMLGAGLGTLGIAAAMQNEAALKAVTALGLSPAVVAAGSGGLVGFGVGMGQGKLAGSISGGATGALVGLMVGGPVGALIGGVAGVLGGIFGGVLGGTKRRNQAEQIARGINPQIDQVLQGYETFQIEYQTALDDLDEIKKSAWSQLSQLKGEGRRIFDRDVSKHIDDTRREIEGYETERGRRSRLAANMGLPQFEVGGFVSPNVWGFRPAPGAQLAILHDEEFVSNRQATAKYRPQLEAMNRGQMPVSSVTINGGITIKADKVDAEWLRNGGVRELVVAFKRELLEGGQTWA